MQIRWGKPHGVRRLADAGCELSRDAVRRLQWMNHYLHHGRNCHLHLSPFRHQPAVLLSLVDNLTTLEARSHRPHQVRRPTWSVQQAERALCCIAHRAAGAI